MNDKGRRGEMDDLCNVVCERLPEGWELRIAMEKGAAVVEALSPEGSLLDPSEGTLEQQVVELLDLARGTVTDA